MTARLLLLDRPVDLIEERLDAAIRIGTLADSSAIATRLGSLRRVVVASPDYLARRGRPERPRMSRRMTSWCSAGWRGAGISGEGAVRVTPRLTVSTAEAAIDAVVAGLGHHARAELSGGRRVGARRWSCRCSRGFGREEIPVHLLYPGGAHPPPKLRAFIDLAVPQLRARLGAVEQSLR